jgi:hypothetical protein
MGVTTTGGEHRAEGSATVVEVVLGVDTHLDFHVAVVLDHLGRRLGESKVPTTAGGYRRLVCWAEGFGPVRCVGVEGTGSYAAGLARHLEAAGIAVVEVERPKRRHLRRRGKSDPIDAETAARAVGGVGRRGGGRAQKSGDGLVEMIRTLRGARRSAVKARGVQAANLLQVMLVSAPEGNSADVCAGYRRRSWWQSRHGCAPLPIPSTWKEPRGSRSDRWPAVTRPSRRRSPG